MEPEYSWLTASALSQTPFNGKYLPSEELYCRDRGGAKRVTSASADEIASAKTSGKVWVNTDSGVYHKNGQYYGATKQGKFMSEQDAVKAGYRQAK